MDIIKLFESLTSEEQNQLAKRCCTFTIEEKEKRMKELESALEEYGQRHRGNIDRIRELENKVASYQDRLENLEGDKFHLVNTIYNLQQEVECRAKTSHITNNKLVTLQDELEKYKEQWKADLNRLKELHGIIDCRDEEIKDLKFRLDRCHDTIDKLHKELDKMNKSASENKEEYRAINERQKRVIGEQSETIKRLKTNREPAFLCTEEVLAKNRELSERVADLEKCCDLNTTITDNLLEEKRQLQIENNNLWRENKELEERIEVLLTAKDDALNRSTVWYKKASDRLDCLKDIKARIEDELNAE